MNKSLQEYLVRAKKERWALAQFNFSCAEQLQGVVQAAVRQRSPLLLGTSENDAGFLGMRQAVALVEAWRRETGIPIFLNFDHARSLESIKKAVEAGYDAVHFDGSRLDFEDNIRICKRVVALAVKHHIQAVEGEIEEIVGHSTIYRSSVSKSSATANLDQLEYFTKETGIDSLAVNIGSAHGMYKGGEKLNLSLLQEIQKRVQCFLVLHGGSGIDAKDMIGAIKLGIVKVNISTEIRAAFSSELRRQLKKHPEEITPYNIFPPVVEAVQKVVEKQMQFFESADKI